MRKAILTTSANPFHYGHLSLYKEGGRIFGKYNIKVAIGKNANKDMNFNRIQYHLTPYNINYDIAEGITLADYCKNNSINYIVRGIRNGVDAEYELKLDFLNKEINKGIQTLFFPTKHLFSNISSSTINELLKYNKLDIVKRYMNEDAMYRYINKEPTFIIYFGKSCVGKTYYLNNILKIKNINIDNIFWDIFSVCYGEELKNKIKQESFDCMNNKVSMNKLIKQYSTELYWNTFFDYIKNNFEKTKINNTKLKITNDVYVLDFASFGVYWHTIPSYLKGQLYLIKITNNKRYIKDKSFETKIDYLDSQYKEPDYYDEVIEI